MFVRFRKSRWLLKVYVVESARRDGKVVQLIVAYLGSIDVRTLMVPDEERERISIASRVAFWEEADPKLKNLVNRIGGEAEVKRVRMMVHARIPWPMQPERIRLDLLTANAKADSEAKVWHKFYEHTKRNIERHEGIIAKHAEEVRRLRDEGLRAIRQANNWKEDAEAARKKITKFAKAR